MSDIPIHAWFRPRLIQLLAEAHAAGIAHDVAVAVLIDLITGAEFNPPAPLPEPERGQAAAAGYQPSSITED